MSSHNKTFHLAPSLTEEVMVVKKQGIESILGSDCERILSASLRRTLSADMSSKKWQAQHGFYPLKKIASSDGFQVSITDSSSSEGEEDYDQERPKLTSERPRGQFDDIWSSIQEEKKKKEVEKPGGQLDIWSSIISQKAQEDSKNLPPPYVHPLVKRSASCLWGKSLEICTESLGSETGSDGFSSYSPSETGDAEEDKEEEQQERVLTQKYDMEDLKVVKFNLAGKEFPPRSFPPPIPSLSSRNGASLRMRSRRDNGRLLLEAVSVPSQNNFRAQRQDGRLVLTFINSTPNEGEEEEEKKEEAYDREQFDVEFENSKDGKEYEEDEEEETEEEEEEVKCVIEQAPKGSCGIMSVNRVPPIMNKSMVLVNRNPKWPNKFNEIIKFEGEGEGEGEEEEEEQPITRLTQSLPPRPPVARMITSPLAAAAIATAKTPASLNVYEYFWRAKPMAATVPNPVTQKPVSISTNNNKLILSKNLMPNEQQELVVLRGNKADYLVPLVKGCKQPRLLFWEPHCIATS